MIIKKIFSPAYNFFISHKLITAFILLVVCGGVTALVGRPPALHDGVQTSVQKPNKHSPPNALMPKVSKATVAQPAQAPAPAPSKTAQAANATSGSSQGAPASDAVATSPTPANNLQPAPAGAAPAVNPVQYNDCLNHLQLCGFPNDSNTGWQPTGVTLKPSGDGVESQYVIDNEGAVIDSLDISGCVSVRASNVTIRRSRVRCTSYFPIVTYDAYKNLLVEDVEIDGLANGFTNAAVGFSNYTLRRANIHNISEGPHPSDNVLIEDNYIHDMVGCDICHVDAIQSDGANNVIIRHNTLINQAWSKNSAVRFATEGSASDNVLIENNLLEGGNYEIQINSQGHGFPQHVRVFNNRFGRDYRFGVWDVEGGNIQAAGNVMDNNGEPAPEVWPPWP